MARFGRYAMIEKPAGAEAKQFIHGLSKQARSSKAHADGTPAPRFN